MLFESRSAMTFQVTKFTGGCGDSINITIIQTMINF